MYSLPIPKQKTFFDSFMHACFASMNAGASIALASMALGHFNTQICVNYKDTSKAFGSSASFCLPTAQSAQYSEKIYSYTSEKLNTNFSDSFLDFSATVAAILSLYFANQSYKHFKEVF